MKKKISKKQVKKLSPMAVTIVNQTALQPELVENKLTLPKTWIAENQVLKMTQRTPSEHIYNRPAKGGGTWNYVTGVYVQKVLNYVFGWNWDFEIVKEEEKYGSVIVLGKLTVKDGKGNAITKMQFGRADIKVKKGTTVPLDYGNDCKAAATDSLKKCASELGIASDIYGKNEFKEAGKIVNDESTLPITKNAVMGKSSPTEAPSEQLECHECAKIITKAEHDYSKQRYGKSLCRDCQATKK